MQEVTAEIIQTLDLRRRPALLKQICQATFKKHCHYPKCDCEKYIPPNTRRSEIPED